MLSSEHRPEPLEGGTCVGQLLVGALVRRRASGARRRGAPAPRPSRTESRRRARSRPSERARPRRPGRPLPRGGSGPRPGGSSPERRASARPPTRKVWVSSSSSAAASRAVFRSPAASAISTCAGRRRMRPIGSVSRGERALDGGRGGVDLALREAEKCDPGLRAGPPLLRLPVGLFRGGEVATPSPDLADLVEAGRRGPGVEPLCLLAGLQRLLLRLGPVAAQALDRRPVHAAGAGEALDVTAGRTSGLPPSSIRGRAGSPPTRCTR